LVAGIRANVRCGRSQPDQTIAQPNDWLEHLRFYKCLYIVGLGR
jgi:hypothetical protein